MIAPLLGLLLHTALCHAGATNAPAVCGTLTVPENRSLSHGRAIALHFIVIKAKHPSHRAVVFNPGGPGGSATAMAEDFADADPSSAFTRLRDTYDLLLLDNRGTGESAPQNCDFAPRSQPQLYFAQMWPDSLVKQCRKRLAAKADLSDYATMVAAEDLDDVRAALDYPKLVLYGGSYGTRFYLAYARQYPQRVESMVLSGVAPPHFLLVPLEDAGGAQLAMTGLIKACAADASCSTHFPSFGEHFAALVQRFQRGPVEVPIRNSITKRLETVALSKEVFADRLRQTLYQPSKAAYVPVIVERAYHGNYAPLASMIDETTQGLSQIVAGGLNLSVTCAEDIPYIREDAISRTSANTFEGDARVRAQQRACGIWNVRPVPRSFQQPVRSDAPILLINGTDDPASPISYAQEELPYLSHARLLPIKGGSHDSDAPCVDPIVVAFVHARSAKGLDLNRCGASYSRPAFATLAPYESESGENLALRKRLEQFFVNETHGKIDRSQLEPALAKDFTAQAMKSFVAQLAGIGSMEAFIYKGSQTSRKGRTYKYLVHFDNANLLASFTIDAKRRFAALDISPA